MNLFRLIFIAAWSSSLLILRAHNATFAIPSRSIYKTTLSESITTPGGSNVLKNSISATRARIQSGFRSESTRGRISSTTLTPRDSIKSRNSRSVLFSKRFSLQCFRRISFRLRNGQQNVRTNALLSIIEGKLAEVRKSIVSSPVWNRGTACP